MIDGPQHLTGYPLRDYDDLIARLAESRLSQHLTQAEVAARIGHTAHVDISRWLSGARTMTGPSQFDLADALDYDLALIPRDTDAPSACRHSPQTAAEPSGVHRPRVEPFEAVERLSAGTHTCGHCGNPMRGYASAGDTWLCHPDTGLDCYRLVTVYGHATPCATCPLQETHPGTGTHE